MLTEKERVVLELIGKKMLITKEELKKGCELEPGVVNESVYLLKDNGFIEILNPIGSSSVIITQKGMRALRTNGGSL